MTKNKFLTASWMPCSTCLHKACFRLCLRASSLLQGREETWNFPNRVTMEDEESLLFNRVKGFLSRVGSSGPKLGKLAYDLHTNCYLKLSGKMMVSVWGDDREAMSFPSI